MINKQLNRSVQKQVFTAVFLLFTCFAMMAQNSQDELFKQGNELYRSEKFEKAISIYKQIEKAGTVSSELYFNLGNAHYKLNHVAESVYNYEKALKINPLNKDAAVNLVFAKRMTIDVIEELPKSFSQKLNESFIQKLTYNEWAIVVVVFSILSTLFFLLFYFSYIPLQKRMYFIVSGISVIVFFTSLFVAYSEYQRSINTVEAIVFSEKVDVKDAPISNGEIIFELHEGTKVAVLEKVDSWKKIRIADGKIGWVNANSIQEF